MRVPTPEEQAEIVAALHSLRMPLPASADVLQAFAERARICEALRGEVIIDQGAEPDYLYLVLGGQLRAADTSSGSPRLLSYHVAPTFVGERGMLHRTPRSATVDVVSDARLACWDQPAFDALVSSSPDVHNYFDALYTQRVARAERPFPGKQWDEVVVYKGGKHILQLISAVTAPLALLFAGILVGIGLSMVATPLEAIEAVAGIPATIGLAWALFNYFDWRNDEYIVTSKRVIHIERMLLYGEEWDEAPLVRIQDVTVLAHTWIQRQLDYSDLTIKTAGAGNIVFAGVKQAEHVRELIFQEQARARERRAADDKASIRQALAHKIGRQVPDIALPVDVHAPTSGRYTPPRRRRLPPLIDYLYPRLAIVDNDSIAWRKHWLVLARKVLPPLTLLAAAAAMTVILFRWDEDNLPLIAVSSALALGALIWYLMRYDDWHRDVYIVTGNRIIDVDSSAFRLRGERRREGTFDAVQNVTYTIPNFAARLLNMGDVVIETAGTQRTFTFNSVFDPSGIQQEIFNRWDAYHEERRHRERESEAARLAEWIGEYHELQHQPS
jgi:hypothetical protein